LCATLVSNSYSITPMITQMFYLCCRSSATWGARLLTTSTEGASGSASPRFLWMQWHCWP
jgi:hypothetical protein